VGALLSGVCAVQRLYFDVSLPLRGPPTAHWARRAYTQHLLRGARCIHNSRISFQIPPALRSRDTLIKGTGHRDTVRQYTMCICEDAYCPPSIPLMLLRQYKKGNKRRAELRTLLRSIRTSSISILKQYSTGAGDYGIILLHSSIIQHGL
jgi:hypothetical protein